MISPIKSFMAVCILLITHMQINAQQVESKFELLEIIKLSEVYRKSPSLSFSLNYTYADSINSTTYVEQLSGLSKASNGYYWTMLDSVEIVQGHQYNVTAYHKDSTIIVSDRQKYGDLLKMPFLDSAFRKSNIDSVSVTNINSTTREFRAFFKPGSDYSKYTVQYNLNTYLVNKIQYYVKDNSDTAAIPSGTGLITLTISSYSTSAVDPSVFNENRFIYNQNGELYKQPDYTVYTLINNTTN